jgi:hypothetical protein
VVRLALDKSIFAVRQKYAMADWSASKVFRTSPAGQPGVLSTIWQMPIARAVVFASTCALAVFATASKLAAATIPIRIAFPLHVACRHG